MQRVVRPLLLVSLVLIVPIAPFLIWGQSVQQSVERWFYGEHTRSLTGLVVVGLLSLDIFLPVPSSFVSTWGGAKLGSIGGTVASTVGMSIGGILGYVLAGMCGRPLVSRFAAGKDLEQMEQLSRSIGPMLIVVTRALPAVAEATVLLLGLHGLRWRRFWPALVASNFAVAACYSSFGNIASRHEWLPLAFCISLTVPMLLTLLARRWLRQTRSI